MVPGSLYFILLLQSIILQSIIFRNMPRNLFYERKKREIKGTGTKKEEKRKKQKLLIKGSHGLKKIGTGRKHPPCLSVFVRG
jgi:hypothetical protein